VAQPNINHYPIKCCNACIPADSNHLPPPPTNTQHPIPHQRSSHQLDHHRLHHLPSFITPLPCQPLRLFGPPSNLYWYVRSLHAIQPWFGSQYVQLPRLAPSESTSELRGKFCDFAQLWCSWRFLCYGKTGQNAWMNDGSCKLRDFFWSNSWAG
jgi:hypothetical protein